jgi:hypothetical protein
MTPLRIALKRPSLGYEDFQINSDAAALAGKYNLKLHVLLHGVEN